MRAGKKVFIYIMIICGCLFGIDMESNAATYTGSCGLNVDWTIDTEEHTMVLSGMGKVEVSEYVDEAPWYEYKSEVLTLTVEEGITELGTGAVYGFPNLTKVVLPASLEVIGDSGFNSCIKLQEVNLPNNLKTIRNNVFYKCESLREIVVPESVTTIGTGVFMSCTGLQKVTWDADIQSLPDHTFNNCISLKEVSLSPSLESMGAGVFSYCSSIESITLPDRTKQMGEGTFNGCKSLKSVELPASLTSVGASTFAGCSNLENVVLPTSLQMVPTNTFYNCSSLRKIEIPDSVTNIGESAFVNCISLGSVYIPKNTTVMTNAFSNSGNGLTVYGYTGTSAENEMQRAGITFIAYDNAANYSIYLSNYSYVCSGQANTPGIGVYFYNEQLTSSDYTFSYKNNVNVGTASVTVQGKNRYGVTLTEEFYISSCAIEESGVSIGETQYTYDGQAKVPAIVVKCKNKVLKEGTDYSLQYGENVDAGTGKAIITGTGNYSGFFVKTFTINKRSQIITAESLTKAYGSKAFKLNASVDSGLQLSYKSNNKKVAKISETGKVQIVGYGKATITISTVTNANYLPASKKITITVVPKQQKIVSLSSPGKRKLNIIWKKDKTATGYEVVFSKSKNFKKGTYEREFKAKTIGAKLINIPKSKAYYVKVRSFKKVGKNYYYGDWSTVKRVKLK